MENREEMVHCHYCGAPIHPNEVRYSINGTSRNGVECRACREKED